MTAKPTHKRKRVVIVGASFAGLWCQRNLCKDFDVTVVDYKRYFEYTPGILRVFVELGHLPRITAALPKMGSKFVCGEAVGIDSGRSLLQVKTKTGQDVQEIPFDYLLIGTGSSYSGSIKPSVREVTSSDRLATWTSEFERLRRAHSVLIVGGGPVGVELAGEILTRYPEKRVIITDRAKELCAAFHPSTRSHVKRWLQKHKCNLVLGESIGGKYPDLSIDSKGCTLSSGRRLSADVVYRCMGFKPCSKWIANSIPKECVDSKGFLIVNDHLQLKGFPNIFAMGDVMTHESNEIKLGHTAEVNAHLVVDNLQRLETKRPLQSYPFGVVGARRTPRVYCVSLGKYDASLGFNWLIVNGPVAAVFKWLLEWTKVMACREAPIGIFFWIIADKMSNFIGKYLIKTQDS
eukprot:CAMPEP_0170170064 /NCGR_PEP_ID=MMETSP0040_2-20121228/3019_1 /TAXON_ID=641309 /ORGANISM="Lotharella oceanica, Strain CCMP622" /LENGTH=404 /DNA_ID=CAMNT_0010409211 /DNA_START=65 /DNA_END=1279 /DNA_ORIENTATION=+